MFTRLKLPFGALLCFAASLACWFMLWLLPQVFTQHWPFQMLFAFAFFLYCGILWHLPHLRIVSPRTQVTLAIGGTLILHLPLLSAPRAFSDDVYRYVWNGRVSAAGIDPYAYAPGDPTLVPLRDERIWPNINAKNQPSPYPPLLEATFALIYRLAPEEPIAMRIGMTLLNIGITAALAALLRHRGLPMVDAIIYGWNPAAVFQTAFGAHNEPLMLLCLMLALLAAHHRRYLLGGVLVGLGVLSKLLPFLMLPALWLRWGWRALAAALLMSGVVYGTLLLRGQHVLAGVLYEADTAVFNDGAYYLISRLASVVAPTQADTLTRLVATGLTLTAVGWGAVWGGRKTKDRGGRKTKDQGPKPATDSTLFGLSSTVFRLLRLPPDLAPAMGIALAAYLIFAASVMPWYALWLLPFVALDALPRAGKDQGPGGTKDQGPRTKDQSLATASQHQLIDGVNHPLPPPPLVDGPSSLVSQPPLVYGPSSLVWRTPRQLLLSFWLVFSWTAVFAELYFFETRGVWLVAHALAWLIPLAALTLGWFIERRAAQGDQRDL